MLFLANQEPDLTIIEAVRVACAYRFSLLVARISTVHTGCSWLWLWLTPATWGGP